MENIIKCFVSLSVAELSEKLDSQIIKLLEEGGVELNRKNLSEALYSYKGNEVFKDKNFRQAILASYKRRGLTKKEKDSCEFRWTNMKKVENYFYSINVPIELLDLNKDKKKIFENKLIIYNSLHDYQQWTKFKILNFFNSREINESIVHMPTGSGKTRVTIEALVDYLRISKPIGKKIVWMAHSDELCEQACETFELIWNKYGSREINIIKLWGGANINRVDFNSLDFIVTSFNTAYNLIKTGKDSKFKLFVDIRKKTDILVVDEAHQSTAETYGKAIRLFRNNKTKLLGLTATPGRISNVETKELVKFYNYNLIELMDGSGNKLGVKAMEYLQQRGILSMIKRLEWEGSSLELGKEEINSILEKLDVPQKVLTELGIDSKRNALIAENTAHLALNENKKTIVFAPSKDSAVAISFILKLKNCEAESVTYDTPTPIRKQIIENFKKGKIKVITNFGVLTAGFDAPKTDAIVIARPTTSLVLYSQMIGRGLRGEAMGGTKNCTIVDVIDNIIAYKNIDNQFIYYNKFYEKKH